jgi:hypothetical protein
MLTFESPNQLPNVPSLGVLRRSMTLTRDSTRAALRDAITSSDPTHHLPSRLLHLTLNKAKSLLYPPGETSTAEIFDLFPLLPFEIRALIWYFARPDPRILEVSTRFSGYTMSGSRMWYSTSPPPALLSVSQEARREAQRYYKRAFARNGYDAMTYVDFRRDTIFIHRWGSFRKGGGRYSARAQGDGFVSDEDWKNVRMLALSRGAFVGLEGVAVKEVLGCIDVLWCIEGWSVGRRQAKLREGVRIRAIDMNSGLIDQGLKNEVEEIQSMLRGVQWDDEKGPVVRVGHLQRRFDEEIWVDCEY